MKMATTLAEQRRWMAQWRATAIMLDEARRDKLANLTEQGARRQIRNILDLPYGWRDAKKPCGLIEPQAFFQRLDRRVRNQRR